MLLEVLFVPVEFEVLVGFVEFEPVELEVLLDLVELDLDGIESSCSL